MSSVPPLQFTPTGVVVPPESAVLAGVIADINAAFGGNLNPALNTPQGQLATSEAAVIASSNALFAYFVNQVDPDNASGFMQDAIARIYFLNRNPGLPTAVQCTCTGAFGTAIPVGAQAQDTSGNLYVCTEAGSIPVGGSIVLSFANVNNGPIPCPANTLTQIYQAIPGWESVNNSAAGVVGADVESRAAFEYRRQQSVAANAQGSLAAIGGAIWQVPGVIDVYVTENFTNATVNTGSTNYPVTAHSLYAAVVGGEAAAIAQAIWTKKSPGCNMDGNTTVTVTDPSYQIPQPTYPITFEIPAALPIFFHVQIANSTSLPSNIVALVQAAVIAQFTGANGGTRARIASLLLASQYYGAVQAIGPEVSVLSILIGVTTPGALTSYQVGIDQVPTLIAADITVTLV